MKTLNLTTLLLVIVGGVNWGLIGMFDFNLVSALFGIDSILSNLIYTIVGISAIYQLVPFSKATSIGEPRAEAAHV